MNSTTTRNRRTAIALLSLPSTETLADRLKTAAAALNAANEDETASRSRLIACCDAVWSVRNALLRHRDLGFLIPADLLTAADEAADKAARTRRFATFLPR